MTVHIKLYGTKGDRFEEIKAAMTEHMGYEPSNPEVVGMLMAQVESEAQSTGEEPTVPLITG